MMDKARLLIEIRGPAGIGKSAFLAAAMSELKADGLEDFAVFHAPVSHTCEWMHQIECSIWSEGELEKERMSITKAQEILVLERGMKKLAYIFCDGCAPPLNLEDFEGVVIVTVSPSISTKTLRDQIMHPNIIDYVMPPWSLEEIKQAGDILGVDNAVIEDNLSHMNGIVRHAFAPGAARLADDRMVAIGSHAKGTPRNQNNKVAATARKSPGTVGDKDSSTTGTAAGPHIRHAQALVGGEDGSIEGTAASTSSRPGLPIDIQKALAELIEGKGGGLAKARDQNGKNTLAALLDTADRPDIFGKRGTPLRRQIRKYVSRWIKLDEANTYTEKVLNRLLVKSAATRREEAMALKRHDNKQAKASVRDKDSPIEFTAATATKALESASVERDQATVGGEDSLITCTAATKALESPDVEEAQATMQDEGSSTACTASTEGLKSPDTKQGQTSAEDQDVSIENTTAPKTGLGSRQGLPKDTQKALAELMIEGKGGGMAKARPVDGKNTMAALLDTADRPDIFGKRGDPLRRQISKYVCRWIKLDEANTYTEKVLNRLSVKSAATRRREAREAKKAIITI